MMDRILDLLLSFYGPAPYLIIFGILLACGLGIPLPEDVTLFVAGVSAYYGMTNLWVITAVSYAGIILGDSFIFFLGAKYGRKLTKIWFFHKVLPDQRLDEVRVKFQKRGNKLIFAARFMPGFRAPIYFSAGTLHMPFRVFLFYDGTAALVSVPTIVGAVYYFGDELDRVLRVIKRIEYGVLFVILAIIASIGAKWYLGHRRLKERT